MTASQSKPLASVRRGFASLPCIRCGNSDGNITVSLEDVSHFHCQECGEDFNANAVLQHIAQWQAVLVWCDAAPTMEG